MCDFIISFVHDAEFPSGKWIADRGRFELFTGTPQVAKTSIIGLKINKLAEIINVCYMGK